MIRIPKDYKPTVDEVKKYIDCWNGPQNEVGKNKELALKKLFEVLCSENKDINDVLIKCSTLNDFYSTNIFDVHSVAQRIWDLDIDERLRQGDLTLVSDIAHVWVGKQGKSKTERCFYSFATKYCSHHQPEKYAIYDNYVEKVLVDFNKKERGDRFSCFTLKNLKDYKNFIRVIRDFQNHFGLTQFTLKELDQYLWQLGKKYYGKYDKK